MKAIIVAGGKGQRLRPLTDTLPKPMIAIAEKPILGHIINLFQKNGVTDFIISLCYLPDKITNYFGDGKKFGVTIRYIYEDENVPLGTAGNIADAKAFINETCIVTYADILRELTITDMITFHKKNKAFGTLNIYKRFGPNPKSTVIFDENKKITSFVERPKQEILHDDFVWSNGSFYIFEPEIFDFIPQKTFKDFGKDVFPKLLKEKKDLYAYPSDGLFIDIGTYEKLEKAKELITK
jgi:mannose-1-phosphate guanylyltransferase / phosphomannomutase